MAERFHEVTAVGVKLVVDLAVGHIRSFAVEQSGRRLAPLHTAPWVEEKAIIEDPSIPANLKYLSGDFCCAPFTASDVEPAPPHGWPANSAWRPVGEERQAGAVVTRLELEKRVMGARLIKEITLRDGQPFVYLRHVFAGGEGAVSVASHAMTHFDQPGRLSFSAKAFGELPRTPQESDPARGRSLFARDKRFTDLAKLPLADGTTVDLHRYPVAERHEDFVMLVEARGAALGWAAAMRRGAGDMLLSLKNPADYPVTFLWFSNGGRFYPPWNGRHRGVLGIEEGRAYSSYGHAASIAPNPLSEAGIPTALTLVPAGSVSVRHVLAALALPPQWTKVNAVEAGDGVLRVAGDGGDAVTAPFDDRFLS